MDNLSTISRNFNIAFFRRNDANAARTPQERIRGVDLEKIFKMNPWSLVILFDTKRERAEIEILTMTYFDDFDGLVTKKVTSSAFQKKIDADIGAPDMFQPLMFQTISNRGLRTDLYADTFGQVPQITPVVGSSNIASSYVCYNSSLNKVV